MTLEQMCPETKAELAGLSDKTKSELMGLIGNRMMVVIECGEPSVVRDTARQVFREFTALLYGEKK